MLTEIREKSQGTFAWVILILICVPFALWGLNNYTDGGQESSVVVVGDREFGQNEVNQAYTQFRQQYAQMQIPEEVVQKQALEKLISDELLLQHVVAEKLTITDETVRQFIASLEYFQKDGKFDKKQYEAMLGQQGMSPAQFVSRIRKALLMEQYQKAVTETSFVSEQDIARFFKIQNQTRKIEYATVRVIPLLSTPSAEEINTYYQQNTAMFQSAEQVSVEYVELSITELMGEVEPTDTQLDDFYQENIELYSTKERRKISHILFAKTAEVTEEQALINAKAAQARLAQESFADLAQELSNDTLTAKTGGDLGLFEVGIMEPAFEKAASELTLGAVSAPVKSDFGYHLIKVTELVPATTKSFTDAKTAILEAVKRAEAETIFYELGESLTELSFENSDSLIAVSDDLGVAIKKTTLFTQAGGEGLAEEEAVRKSAFSETVLKGNNSEPIEIGDDRLVVLRLLERQPAEAKPLAEVEQRIIVAIKNQQAKDIAQEKAEKVEAALLSGSTIADVAKGLNVKVASVDALRRDSKEVSSLVNQAVFKAVKPVPGQATIFRVDSPQGDQTVVKLISVAAGAQTAEDKERATRASANIARALGESDYSAVMNTLRASTKVLIK